MTAPEYSISSSRASCETDSDIAGRQGDEAIAGTAKDFRQGYEDAYLERGYRPTSVQYVDGYERGRAVRLLLRAKP